MTEHWKVQIKGNVYVCKGWRMNEAGDSITLTGLPQLPDVKALTLDVEVDSPIAMVRTNEDISDKVGNEDA